MLTKSTTLYRIIETFGCNKWKIIITLRYLNVTRWLLYFRHENYFISKLRKQEGNVLRNVVNTNTSLFIFNKRNGKVNPLSCILGNVIWFDVEIHLMFNLCYKTDIVDRIRSLSHECWRTYTVVLIFLTFCGFVKTTTHMGIYSGICMCDENVK